MILGNEPNVRLVDILDADVIRIPLDSSDKWDAIRELVDHCVAAGTLHPDKKDAALEAVVHREETMSTGLERGIAIPHGASTEVDEIVAALGVCREGIIFDSVDGEKTSLILLMIIPKNKFQKHIRTLAGISRLLNHDDLRQRIIESENADEVMEIIRNAEKSEYL